jgi:hypothetical protein
MSLYLEAAGLEVQDEAVARIADTADIADSLTQLADAIGKGEVERRRAGKAAHASYLVKRTHAFVTERRERCPA